MSTTPTSSQLVDVDVVRIRLGAERSVPQPDPLGNRLVGYRPGLTPAQLWARGRGLWKAKLENVAAADLVVLTSGEDDHVVLVGTIDGVRFYDERVAIEGRPLPDHPLIGAPDPVPNKSRNPIAYGRIRTVPSTAFRPAARPAEDVLADAIRVLTEATRLRRSTMRQTAAGGWEVDPGRTEPADWAEFVTLALAGAAANAGGIENVLVGRPGSWEAGRVRDTLYSTVGEDEATLWQHRTEPLRLVLDPDLGPFESLYEISYDHLAGLEEAARAPYAGEQHRWTYQRSNHDEFVCSEPGAPSWDGAALDRLREDLRALGAPESFIENMPSEFTVGVWISKTDADRAAIVDLERQADAAAAPFQAQQQALDVLEKQDRADYLAALRETARAEAERRYPGVAVDFIDPDTAPRVNGIDFHDYDSTEAQLVEYAELHTVRPWDDNATMSDPLPSPHEVLRGRTVGRLPHERLTDGGS